MTPIRGVANQKIFGIILEKKKRKKMDMIKMFSDTKARIWGSESYACTIICYPMLNRYAARCESTGEEKRLTAKNYERVLNDMFYDYCVENASYMGVS